MKIDSRFRTRWRRAHGGLASRRSCCLLQGEICLRRLTAWASRSSRVLVARRWGSVSAGRFFRRTVCGDGITCVGRAVCCSHQAPVRRRSEASCLARASSLYVSHDVAMSESFSRLCSPSHCHGMRSHTQTQSAGCATSRWRCTPRFLRPFRVSMSARLQTAAYGTCIPKAPGASSRPWRVLPPILLPHLAAASSRATPSACRLISVSNRALRYHTAAACTALS